LGEVIAVLEEEDDEELYHEPYEIEEGEEDE
jgi:hypothetical protein